jgi:hypothetical protein
MRRRSASASYLYPDPRPPPPINITNAEARGRAAGGPPAHKFALWQSHAGSLSIRRAGTDRGVPFEHAIWLYPYTLTPSILLKLSLCCPARSIRQPFCRFALQRNIVGSDMKAAVTQTRRPAPSESARRFFSFGVRPRGVAPAPSTAWRRASRRAPRYDQPACAGQWRSRHGSREPPCMRRRFPSVSCPLLGRGSDRRGSATCVRRRLVLPP